MPLKILVTAKRVEDPESRIRVRPDGAGIVTEGVSYRMNPFDEIAVEEALRLREKHGGEVVAVAIGAFAFVLVSVIYIMALRRGMPEEEVRATHRLYGFVDAAENYSVGRWCRDVEEALKEARSQGRMPILVGGTGLYFKALTTGLAAVPPIPADIRAEVRSRLQREGPPALHAELARLDPATAQRVTINDRSRISRALEVVLATGRPLSDWHSEGLPPLIDSSRVAKVFISCERKELLHRIERRFAAMLKSGALEEVRRLAARGLDPSLPAMKAHGVPWLIRHLDGEISLEEAVGHLRPAVREAGGEQRAALGGLSRDKVRAWFDAHPMSRRSTRSRLMCTACLVSTNAPSRRGSGC